MYNAFFGFTQSPFNLSADPAFLFRSRQHEAALANLTYGVQSRKGFVVLTGEAGTGKTTMLECLRDHLFTQNIEFAFLFNSRITPAELFEMIAFDMDLGCDRRSKPEVLYALNELLIKQEGQGRTTALIIDEAHNLEWDVLEEVRMLGNLENRSGKLLQVVLAGQPELDRKLEAPNLQPLKQRVVIRSSLKPLSERETIDYIEARLAIAGLSRQTFLSRDLLTEIHARAQGIPRVINAICDNLLLTAFAHESRTATPEMLDEVTTDLRLDWPAAGSGLGSDSRERPVSV